MHDPTVERQASFRAALVFNAAPCPAFRQPARAAPTGRSPDLFLAGAGKSGFYDAAREMRAAISGGARRVCNTTQ
jgi:hypothetical protein